MGPPAEFGLMLRALFLGLVTAGAGGAYFALTTLLKVEEAWQFLGILKRKAKR